MNIPGRVGSREIQLIGIIKITGMKAQSQERELQ